MIILDEQLADPKITQTLRRWYQGQVTTVSQLPDVGPGRSDELIPPLLQRYRYPTFVTINSTDFWRRFDGHFKYAVVCLTVPQDHTVVTRVPELIRRLLRHPSFLAKADRCGRIFRVTFEGIEYYCRRSEEPTRVDWLYQSRAAR